MILGLVGKFLLFTFSIQSNLEKKLLFADFCPKKLLNSYTADLFILIGGTLCQKFPGLAPEIYFFSFDFLAQDFNPDIKPDRHSGFSQGFGGSHIDCLAKILGKIMGGNAHH